MQPAINPLSANLHYFHHRGSQIKQRDLAQMAKFIQCACLQIILINNSRTNSLMVDSSRSKWVISLSLIITYIGVIEGVDFNRRGRHACVKKFNWLGLCCRQEQIFFRPSRRIKWIVQCCTERHEYSLEPCWDEWLGFDASLQLYLTRHVLPENKSNANNKLRNGKKV